MGSKKEEQVQLRARRVSPGFRLRTRVLTAAVAVLVALALPAHASAQSPQLVKDINTSTAGSGPAAVTIGSVAYMAANDGIHGSELWVTDGTAAGTSLVSDLVPGANGSNPGGFTDVAGTVYFSATADGQGQELWKTDGTAAGTELVKDIRAGAASSQPSGLIAFGGNVYFRATGDSGTLGLWRSDGTEAGTVLVKEPVNSLPVRAGGMLIFTATDATDGTEIWASDGTASGTTLLRDINPGSTGSNPGQLTSSGGLVFFTADDGTWGEELWKTDGTTSGTVLVEDIRAGSTGSNPGQLVDIDGTLMFRAWDGIDGGVLWKSDGTPAGTSKVSTAAGAIYLLTNVAGEVYFRDSGSELWKSDGTSGGTVLVKDFGHNPIFQNFTAVGSDLFFSARDASGDYELYRSDGTESGTVRVADISPGAQSSSPHSITAFEGEALLAAGDGLHGRELWRSDGTESGTAMVKDINTTTAGSSPADLTRVGGSVFFVAEDGEHGNELWMSDGTAAGTELVKDIRPGYPDSNPTELTNIGGTLFFSANDGEHGDELWKSDGTAAGTELVEDITPPGTNYGNSHPRGFTDFDGVAYFTAQGGLWKSDGTAAGTELVDDVSVRRSGYEPAFTRFGDYLYFAGNDTGGNGSELWRTDGTEAGTTLFKDLYPSSSYTSNPTDLLVESGVLFVRTQYGPSGPQIWRSDGTSSGTTAVSLYYPSGLVGFEGAAYTQSSGYLYRVGADSSPAQLVHPDRIHPWLQEAKVVDGSFYFRAHDQTYVSGYELWRSDGTESGTSMVADINPGSANSNPALLGSVGGELLFWASDGGGQGLWRSDGTGTGTEKLSDLQMVYVSSDSTGFATLGGVAVFRASEPMHAAELWSYEPDSTPPDTTIDSGPSAGAETKDDTPGFGFSSTEPGSSFECQIDGGGFSPCASDDELGPLDFGEHTFEVRATDAAGNTDPTPAAATFTVIEPELSVDDVTVAEGDAGQVDATFTVTLDTAISKPVSVELGSAGDTASSGSDFDALSGELVNFAPGETSSQVTIKVNGDTIDEADESFEAILSNPSNATIADGTGVGTISDDDDPPALSIDDVTVTEGDAGQSDATFTITLDAASEKTVGVDFATADGTATEPADYTANNGTRSFAPSETSKQVTVSVEGDVIDEADESFEVNLSNPSNATVADGTGLGTITDDDDPPTLSIDDVAVDEGDAGQVDATFTVSLDAPSGKAVSVELDTADETASSGSDYDALSGESVSFAAGETSKQVVVKINGDIIDEPDEDFEVGLTNPSNATIADGTGIGTITDDDPAPALSIDDVSVTESDSGQADAIFTISLDAPSGKAVDVGFATADGTATEPGDYAANNGTRSFAPGETSKQVTVQVEGDTIDEPDESFEVTLSDPTNATIADATGVGTISDDDDPPSLSIDDVTVTEGDAGQTDAVFTIALDAASEKTVGVDFATADGTATEPADYAANTGTRSFAPGETSKQVTIAVEGDELDELDETFEVGLSNPANATIADGTGVGTITDDDPPQQLSIDDVTVDEGDAGQVDATFTVSLDAPSGRQVSVDWATADGSATDPADYQANSGTATFAAGETEKQVTVKVEGDTLDEPNETFTVELSAPTGAGIDDGSGTATISDDDPPQQLSIDDVTVDEGDGGQVDATFTISLDAVSGKPVDVDFATADDTATEPEDYEANAGSRTFAPGESAKQVTVKVEGDELDESNEGFTVELANASGAAIDDGTGAGTITDDDDPPALSVDDVTVNEGDSGTADATFTVSLDAPSGRQVQVGHATSDGTATEPVDYAAETATTSFDPGQTSEQVTVEVTGDTTEEPDEDFEVLLSSPGNATIADGTGTGQITNDDPTPEISIDDVTVAEGDSGQAPAAFTVSLSNPTDNAISVELETADGTATDPDDYETKSKTVDFAPGEDEQTVNVQIVGDTLDEPDEELTAELSAPANATIADGEGTATITDDDDPPALSIDDVTVDEGDSGSTDASFTLTLDSPSAKQIDVDLDTADGSATAPSDYEAKSASRTFAPGETSKQVTVKVAGDTIDEPDEDFEADLSNPTNATITDGTGVGTITDDDEPVPDPPAEDGPIEGTPADDVLKGTRGDDVIVAGAGNDVIKGRGGNDVILGGEGNDVIKGGSGDDAIRGGSGKDILRGRAGDDKIIGGKGRDVLNGNGGDDLISGRSGNDLLKGGAGDDELLGKGGNDRLFGGPGTDLLAGHSGNDFLAGNGGNDLIKGGPGRDVGRGGPGDDALKGQAGAGDFLRGQVGQDQLAGGPGASDRCDGGPGSDRAGRSCERARRVP